MADSGWGRRPVWRRCKTGGSGVWMGRRFFLGQSPLGQGALLRPQKHDVGGRERGRGIFFSRGRQFAQLRDPPLDEPASWRRTVCWWTGKGESGWGPEMRSCFAARATNGGASASRVILPRIISAPAGGRARWDGLGRDQLARGLFQFQKAGKLLAINASSGLSDNLGVETLLMDREGKLWVGTHGGLNRILSQELVCIEP